MWRVDSVIVFGENLPLNVCLKGGTKAQADDVRIKHSDLCRGFC